MGLLDDAIREHLDLKRRRGADPDEIERAEREALGPVRRAPDEREPLDPAAEDPLAYDHESDAEWDEADDGAFEPEAGDEREPPVRAGPARAPVRAEESASPRELALDDEHRHDDEDELFEDEEPFSEPEDEESEDEGVAQPPRSSTSEETVEYDVENALERDAGGEDVLEETPEFLQDTPDHDRLWFEQRPPRDFDFNE
jgi:hypothetical protein